MTDQDDTKRRQRARFVDTLTTNAQQPGERSRVGTRVAGAAAVLALAVGATLGLGAWRSYQADTEDKKQELAVEQAAAHKKLPQLPSRSPDAKPKKEEEREEQEAVPGPRVGYPAPDGGVSPSASPKKEQTDEPRSSKKDLRTLTSGSRSKVLLKNASTGMCADVPYYGAGKLGTDINQYHCDGTDKDNQLWNMTVRQAGKGPGKADLVEFSNLKDGLCIDMSLRGARPVGTELSEARCGGTLNDNQLWWLESAGDGTVWIRNYASNHLCLQVKGADQKVVATRLVIGKCGSKDDSRWRLIG